ncbi:sugar ABC transporter periplasmic protein [[Clostridium] cellulosi]|uniref:Sugar ABC transporter periplasmic protein n=1 Tax=[Clostridium] cellulosi TaxID=29343 RepID=A0A078KMP2_9FIRM|nr:sugar ABC transporter periplasmic protein [[Clostridium] cellulosi]
MKKLSVKIGSILLALAMTASLSACSNNSTTSESKSSSSDEKITLSVMHMFPKSNTDGNSIAYNKALDEFKKANPNIIINEEALGNNTYETKIAAVAAGNQLPDLFIYKGSMLDMFINNKLINAVDDVLDKDPEWKNGFYDGIFNDFVKDGKTYGIPFQKLDTHLIFYNTKIFNDVGISEFPTTWAGFVDAIKKIKAKGITPISLGNKDNWVAESCILSTLADRFTGPDWFDSIKNKGGAKFTDPEFVQALTTLQELAKMGAFNSDMNSLDNMQQKTAYYNGKAAMFMEGNWAISSVVNDAPKEISENTSLAILPAVDGGKGDPLDNSAGAAWSWNVNANVTGAKRDAAFKFIKAVTDSHYATIAVENNAFPASKPEKVDNSKLASLSVKYLDISAKFKPVPIYDSQLPADLINVMNTGIQSLMINKMTPQELAQKIQAAYEASK